MKIFIKSFLLLFLLVSTLVFSTCDNSKSELTNNALEANQWLLIKINGKKPLKGTSLSITFKQNKAYGSTGCNSYSGQFDINQNQIKIKSIRSTLMACPSPKGVLQQERQYFQTLSKITHYQITKKKLILKNDQGLELIYKPKKPEKDRSLKSKQQQQQTFLSILQNISKYRIKGSRLSLSTNDNRSLEFHAK